MGYEAFGASPWKAFDEVQLEIGSTVVRYPGGAEAERLFSYENPDATIAINSENGDIRQIQTPLEVVNYALETGSTLVIVLPVIQLLTAGQFGQREFDASHTKAVKDYVLSLLESGGPETIALFELGNEYMGYMTPVEYGKVSSELATIVDETIREIYSQNGWDVDNLPGISVQTWGHTGSEIDLDEIVLANQSVIEQFNDDELSAITSVSDHLYYYEGKNADQSNEHAYGNIDDLIQVSTGLMDAWDNAAGRDLDELFSEWNTHYEDIDNQGLKQVPILLALFGSFVEAGVEGMNFWSTFYHPTSLSGSYGDLTPAGEIFKDLNERVVGMQCSTVSTDSDEIGVHTFSDEGRTVIYISSIDDDGVNSTLDLPDVLGQSELIGGEIIGVDTSQSDGIFGTHSGLDYYNEADLPVQIEHLYGIGEVSGGDVDVDLDPYETLVLVFERANSIVGTPQSDDIHILGDDLCAIGLAGEDTLVGAENAESIYGGSGDDLISGGSGDDLISNTVGDDTINGDEGNDIIVCYSGSNRIFGGSGGDLAIGGVEDDSIDGESGDDWLFGDLGTGLFGSDTLCGGVGDDTLAGRGGADTFVFHPNDGHDVIGDFVFNSESALNAAPVGADFQPALDAVSLVGFGYESEEEAFTHFSEIDGSVVFADGGTLVEFVGVELGAQEEWNLIIG